MNYFVSLVVYYYEIRFTSTYGLTLFDFSFLQLKVTSLWLILLYIPDFKLLQPTFWQNMTVC